MRLNDFQGKDSSSRESNLKENTVITARGEQQDLAAVQGRDPQTRITEYKEKRRQDEGRANRKQMHSASANERGARVCVCVCVRG